MTMEAGIGNRDAPRRVWRLRGILALLFMPALADGQEGLQVSAGFKFGPGGYYGPPYQKQLKSLLTGTKAQQQPGGLYLITDGKFETFLENGQREMLVEAPQCFYDERGDHSIRSAGPLRVQAADGKFSIDGQGFMWRQTNSFLFISNRVHTIVHPELLQPQPQDPNLRTNKSAPEDKGIEILSEQFDYIGEAGVGNYRRNVRVTGADLDMTAATLQFLLPLKQRQLQRLTADENVIIDSGGVRARGQHVTFAPDTGLVHISGQPTWQAALRQGRGDELSIDRSNRIFRATGNAYLEMAGQSLGGSGFLPTGLVSSTNSLAASNHIVEIHSESYEFRTNAADFRGHVLVTEQVGDQSQGALTCGQMTATFFGTNQLERMVAEQNVIISQESKRFTSDKAVYTGTNGILELTGNPAWQDLDRQGKGDIVLLDGQHNQLVARGNAFLRLPADQVDPAGGGHGGAPAKTDSAQATNQFAQIFCQEYTLQPPQSALFQGRVRIVHPQMNLTCETVTLDSPRPDGSLHTIIAQNSVEFDLTDEKDQKIHGTGRKAVYTYNATSAATNDVVELTGNPILVMTNGTFQNSVIILDRMNGRLLAPGEYTMRGVLDASATNGALFPKPKSQQKRRSILPESHD
jgi:lipopolysaccharide export system protein LptA